jgi:CRP-like cAMP-binding protein
LNEGDPEAEHAGFKPAEAERLLASGQLRSLPAEFRLHEGGQGTKALYIVVAGQLEISRTIAGRARVLAHVGPGQMLALMAAFDQGPCPIAVHACTECKVIALDREALSAHLAGEDRLVDEVARKLTLLAIRRLRDATHELADALHFAVASPERHGRIDPVQVARIQVANHVWVLS